MAPLTLAEQILTRASGASARAGEFVIARPDAFMSYESLAQCLLKLRAAKIPALEDPARLHVVLDHYFPAPSAQMATVHARIRQACKRMGINNFYGHAGIGHQVLVERGIARPGMLILGTDSHSTMYGAVGAAGTGVGVTDMTFALATGELWFEVPASIRVELSGALPPFVVGKDVVLALLGILGTEGANYRSLEFGGPGLAALAMADRLTIANMGVELGAKFALFETDSVTAAHFALLGIVFEPQAPGTAATYAQRIDLDLTQLEPMIARPSSPGAVSRVSEVRGVRVDQVFLGSCTNARVEDIAVAARLLKGRSVHANTRMLVTPASRAVAQQALESGDLAILMAAGAHITPAGCGACHGGLGGLLGDGEVCVSTSNRNFPGRMGSALADVYLASPAVAAAAAIAGEIVDPREIAP